MKYAVESRWTRKISHKNTVDATRTMMNNLNNEFEILVDRVRLCLLCFNNHPASSKVYTKGTVTLFLAGTMNATIDKNQSTQK
jgi:hypothetical protein